MALTYWSDVFILITCWWNDIFIHIYDIFIIFIIFIICWILILIFIIDVLMSQLYMAAILYRELLSL